MPVADLEAELQDAVNDRCTQSTMRLEDIKRKQCVREWPRLRGPQKQRLEHSPNKEQSHSVVTVSLQHVHNSRLQLASFCYI